MVCVTLALALLPPGCGAKLIAFFQQGELKSRGDLVVVFVVPCSTLCYRYRYRILFPEEKADTVGRANPGYDGHKISFPVNQTQCDVVAPLVLL